MMQRVLEREELWRALVGTFKLQGNRSTSTTPLLVDCSYSHLCQAINHYPELVVLQQQLPAMEDKVFIIPPALLTREILF